MHIVIFFVLTISFLLGGDAFFFSSRGKKDCVWSTWKKGNCFAKSGKIYRQETRLKIKAKYGGKDCTGSSTRSIKRCSPQQFLAQNYLNTFSQAVISKESVIQESGVIMSSGVHTARIIPYGGGLFPMPALSMPATVLQRKPTFACSTPYISSSGKFQMSGRGCTLGSVAKRAITRQPDEDSIVDSTRLFRDVLFLLDESGSVGEDHFKAELRFAKETLSLLCENGLIDIHKEKTRVAITSFDEKIHVHKSFGAPFERQLVLKEFEKIEFNKNTDGQTCLVKALEYARKTMFTTARSARESDDIYNMVVLVTDGCANCHGNLEIALEEELKEMEERDITFLLVTVGDRASCSKKIEKFARGNHCFLNFEMETWDDFDEFVDSIKNSKQCMERWIAPDATCNPEET